jgi:DNA-binding helix-hairpin-helix protein with protein kinase domain
MRRQDRSRSSFFTGDGRAITLGARLAFGGEGSVYPIEGDSLQVAKIYHEPPDPQQVRKLLAMIDNAKPALDSLTAWPSATLHESPGGPCVGFRMASAIGFKEAHKLYSPRDRKAEFDHADWRFLVRASSNIAKAFAAIHATGNVIGDVNHSSVMIGPDATVRLIDCDSYQLSYGDLYFPCNVGEPLHTAPELFGKSFHELKRTANHDAFGLAVLIFELLFMGKHPFAGAYLDPGDPSLEDKIREFRFAYAANAIDLRVAPPAASLSLSDLPPEMAQMFTLAFAREGAQEGARPSAIEWSKVLDRLFESLATCERDEAHAYYSGAPGCPWCPIEQATGAMLFNPGVAFRLSGSAGFDVDAAWRAIEAVKPPPAHPGFQANALKIALSLAALKSRNKRRLRWSVALLLFLAVAAATLIPFTTNPKAWGAIVLAGIALFGLARGQLKAGSAEAEFGLMVAEGQLHRLQSAWQAEAEPAGFETLFAELKAKKLELQSMPHTRAQKLSELDRSRESRAWRKHMEGHRIAQHPIEGVNLSRCVTLASYRVESAADVSEATLIGIPGIGEKLRRTLITWRKGVERNFHFDPLAGVSPEDVEQLDRELATRRHVLETDLATGSNALSFAKSQIQIAQQRMATTLEEAIMTRDQATADVKALSRW